MKEIFKKIFIIICAICIFCVLTNISFATEENLEFNVVSNTNVSDLVSNLQNETSKEEVMPISEENLEENISANDVYKMGEEITLTEDIFGNVYIMAEKIKIENINIDGNVFLMAEEINIKNTYISGSAYIIGEEIELNSLIKDVYLLGEKIVLGNSSYISRTARIGGNIVNISGLIDKDCNIDGNRITITDNAQILGTLNYNSSQNANIGENAVITNTIANIQEVTQNQEKVKFDFNVFDLLSGALKVFVVGGILILIFNEKLSNNKKFDFLELLKSLLIGICIFIIIPLISLFLMLTIIGAGLGILTILIYVILIYISTIVTSLAIAKNLIKEYSKLKLLGITILVYLVYKVLSLIPVIGALITMVVGLTGMGYIIRIARAKEKKEEVIETL